VLERVVGCPTAVIELSAPSTNAVLAALRRESSSHSKVRECTFSLLTSDWNGVALNYVQVGSLFPTPSLLGTAVCFYTDQTISSPSF
jgi:hypothetical protein